jgi:hypothetical protein
MGGLSGTANSAGSRRRATSRPSGNWPTSSSAQALVEGVLRYGTGARVALPFDLDPFEALFSESAARALATVHEATLPVAFER